MDTPDPPKWRVSGSAQWTATDILLSDDTEGAMRRSATSVAGEFRFADDWTATAGVGVSLYGDLTVNRERYVLEPGPLAVLGVSYRIMPGVGWEPFVMLGLAGSVSTSATESDLTGEEARLTALDARVAVVVGEVFADTFAPYAAIRGFGGPIFWQRGQNDVSGSDKYHYAVGVGALVTAGWMDAFFEVVPLGERSLNVGVAFTF